MNSWFGTIILLLPMTVMLIILCVHCVNISV